MLLAAFYCRWQAAILLLF